MKQETEFFFWKVHLLRHSGWRSFIIFPAFLLAGLLGLYLGGILLLFLAILFLILSLRDFLFPITYKLTPEEIRERGFLLDRSAKWKEIRNVEKEGKIVRITIEDAPGSVRYFNIYLDENEEEIWKRIESLRSNL